MFRVLVPVDEDTGRANAQVDTLLSLPGDTDELSVIVLHVVEEIDTTPDEAGASFIEDLNESLTEVRDLPDSVDLIERRLEEAGIDAQQQQMVGEPAEGILRVARENDVDSIVLGTRKRSPAGKAIFGSVSQAVILETNRDVIISNDNSH